MVPVVSIMLGTCHGLVVVVVVDVVPVVDVLDVDTVVEALALGSESCGPPVSMLPVIVAPTPPPAPPLSVPMVSVELVSVPVAPPAPPPAPNDRPPYDGCCAGGFEQAARISAIRATRRTSEGTPAREWFASRAR